MTGAQGSGRRSMGIWLSEILGFGDRIGHFHARFTTGLILCEKMNNENLHQFYIINALISASTLS